MAACLLQVCQGAKDICRSPCCSYNPICLTVRRQQSPLISQGWCGWGDSAWSSPNPMCPKFLESPFLLIAPLLGSQASFPLQIHLYAIPSTTPNLTAQEEATGPVELRRSPSGCARENPPLTPSSSERGAPSRYHPPSFIQQPGPRLRLPGRERFQIPMPRT